ncbi:hypothetical protein ACFVHB_19255 [Kitasatospora sp. NPDC127111]|uniref:hypothetical protein n=1 Tax=Kitasatospora sp. NPDC127111 TaxID=3345363 RepID=UPI00362A65C9
MAPAPEPDPDAVVPDPTPDLDPDPAVALDPAPVLDLDLDPVLDLGPEADRRLEHELGRLLSAGVQGLHPPVAVMLAEATRRGRVLHRRRRIGQAASAAAVLALAATLALTGLPRTPGPEQGDAPAAPTATASRAPAPEQLRERQRTALRDTLTRLLGPGARLDAEPGADQLTLDPAADAVLWTRYDDGRGAATLSVEVHGPASRATAPSCDDRTDALNRAGYHCSREPGPGPDPQIVEILETSDTAWVTYRIWTPFPDGTRVALAVHNGTLHDSDDPSFNPRRTRDTPPSELARWQQITADQAWRQVPGLADRGTS